MKYSNILTAQDISNMSLSIEKKLDKIMKRYVASQLHKKINKSSDITEDVKQHIISSDEYQQYRAYQLSQLQESANNYHTLRASITDLNEMYPHADLIEKHKLQTVELIEFEQLLDTSSNNTELGHQLLAKYDNNVQQYISSIKNTDLNIRSRYSNIFQNDDLDVLIKMRQSYNLTTDIDSIELYDMYNMYDNIDMSNLLSDITIKSNDNLINKLLKKDNSILAGITERTIVTNEMLATLLRCTTKQSVTNPSTPIITNNLVTCLDNTYTVTHDRSSQYYNNKLYVTRTLGELLFEITNIDLLHVPKETRKQLYMTYDGTRPRSDEYYKWNGVQVLDIDLKKWIERGGNIHRLKHHIFNEMNRYHWLLWVCLSSSGNGIHIYTKVAPPHHIHIDDISKNNDLCKYWHTVNYHHKTSVLYNIIYECRHEFGFVESDFIAPKADSKYDSGFECKYVDRSVGRITSGIRLTYDNNVLVNNNFKDLPISILMGQYGSSPNDVTFVSKILKRNTLIYDRFIDTIVELIGNKQQDDKPVNQFKFKHDVLYGYDLTKINEIPLHQIKYRMRYEVCNTLAALMGKEGLQLAHQILRSTECKNVHEINSFYSSALRNKKEPTKYGMDILQKYGLVTAVKQEFNEELCDKYKLFLKKQLEKSLTIVKDDYDIVMDNDKPYLNDHRDYILNKITGEKINMIYSVPGSGKCLGYDTPVLMHDGSIKMVQDIIVGDRLMGPDSTPRTVLSLARGREEMFKITPLHGGDSYTCNRSHINSYIMSGVWEYKIGNDGPILPDERMIFDYSCDEYLKFPEWKKRRLKMFRVPVVFPYKDVRVDPYFMGLWIGDGLKDCAAIAVGGQDKDILGDYLKEYDVLNNKHIPNDYLYNSRNIRLQLLAGLIDSDGFVQRTGLGYITKLETLANQVTYLCRSLGYAASKTIKTVNDTVYYRVNITGRFDELPLKIERKRPIRRMRCNSLMSSFKIESIGEGDYYGFEIDGDKRFLLGDFTVTHNTEFVKELAKTKRVMLVLPFISVIKNKIETDPSVMDLFECYYDDKDISKIEYGINAVTTFDKFSRANYEKISRMFDYIIIDEEHLLFNSVYRISTTARSIKKLRQLLYVSSNDPFAAKLVLMTGTPTGSEFFFKDCGKFIRCSKRSLDKTMEFQICDDMLDVITRLAFKIAELIESGHRCIVPTNRGDIYTEKIIGMVRYLLNRDVKYGYYKRSNIGEDVCEVVNNNNTIGDYEILFSSNYLSVGIDINDTDKNFAVLYCGDWNGYEIEQFNSRIRRKEIKSYYFIKTLDANGVFDDTLYEEPSFYIQLTEDDINNFIDDRAIAGKKEEFIATYDPVLKTISTPGFTTIGNKIVFDKEEYELTNFENKYNQCFQHPLRIASTLNSYGYNVTVSTQFEGLTPELQKQLKAVGAESAQMEKKRKNDILISTFMDLIDVNKYISPATGLEYNNTIDYITSHKYDVIEDREQEGAISVAFNQFAQPEIITVKSKVALDNMIKHAKYLISRYTPNKCKDIIEQYITEDGILKQKQFNRAINLLKLIEAQDHNELSFALERMISTIYDYVDMFELSDNYTVSYASHINFIDSLVNDYITNIGITINTKYGWDKLRETTNEMFNNIAIKSYSNKQIRFKYNTLPDQDSSQIMNKRSVDVLITRMFNITDDIIGSTKSQKIRNKHIVLKPQSF